MGLTGVRLAYTPFRAGMWSWQLPVPLQPSHGSAPVPPLRLSSTRWRMPGV